MRSSTWIILFILGLACTWNILFQQRTNGLVFSRYNFSIHNEVLHLLLLPEQDSVTTNTTVMSTTANEGILPSMSNNSLLDKQSPSPEDNADDTPRNLDRRIADKSILFVHIGKAGGETIKGILRVGCTSRANKNRRRQCFHALVPSRLSTKVGAYLHCFDYKYDEPLEVGGSVFPKKNPDDWAFLLNLRHPVDRAKSWYEYVHPYNCNNVTDSVQCKAARSWKSDPNGWVAQFYGTCFPTLQDWAWAVTPPQQQQELDNESQAQRRNGSAVSRNAVNCTKLAFDAFRGSSNLAKVGLTAHMRANLQSYAHSPLQLVPRTASSRNNSRNNKKDKSITRNGDRPVLLVRTRLLWSDLKTLDRQLGGTGNFGELEGSAYTHGSGAYRKGKSQDNMTILVRAMCCALIDELRTYRLLVQTAANWNTTTKQEEETYLVERCDDQWQNWNDLEKYCTNPT